MRRHIFLFFILSGILSAQDTAIIPLRDSVIVYGNTVPESGTDLSTVNLNKLANLSLVVYDPLSSLSLLNASYISDFNVLPLLDGADYQEQEFLIDGVPSLFPVSLLGIQSGLNTLLFTSINTKRSLSSYCFRKPVVLNAELNRFQGKEITAAANLSNLRTDNLLFLPLNNLNSKLILGYNRSLLESMKPVYKNIINNSYNFPAFPVYEGVQAFLSTHTNNFLIDNLLMINKDKGTAIISGKDFNFKSNAFSYASKIGWNSTASVNTLTFYYLNAKNNIDYRFNQQQGKVSGFAGLGIITGGADINSKIRLGEAGSLLLNGGYKYESGNSANESSLNSVDKTTAYYRMHSYELVAGYERLISREFMISSSTGISSGSYQKTGFSYNLDVLLNPRADLSCNLVFDYRSSFIPSNTVFYTFQNSIWDPASTNTLYFIDQNDLPIKPVKTLSISAGISKKDQYEAASSEIQLHLFYRQAANLLFSANYPLEVTYYNTDFRFNQDYDAVKYGASIVYSLSFPKLSLTNRISAAFTDCMNSDKENNISHHALNYNPVILSDLVSWQRGNFSIMSYISFRMGRYIFTRDLKQYYSDSSYAYYISTDLTQQENLSPQLRMDLSADYLLLPAPVNLRFGLSILNVFNTSFESNRIYNFNAENLSLEEKSEYINLPRFFILSINIKYEFN